MLQHDLICVFYDVQVTGPVNTIAVGAVKSTAIEVEEDWLELELDFGK